MSDSLAVATASDRLLQAMRSRVACDPVRPLIEALGLNGAYAVQARSMQILQAEGRRVVGHKVGLTSPAVQTQLGVDQPDFGTLLDDMVYHDGADIPARLIQPKVEAEIAFFLAKDVDDEVPTQAAVAAAVDYAVAAIEVVDSRVRDWKISIFDTIADNASSGAFVLGTERRTLKTLDLLGCGMTLESRGVGLSTGIGANCMGNPLAAMAWLAGRLSKLGTPLRAGQVILSGALGPMVTAAPGERYTAQIAGLGKVVAAFD